MLTADESVIVDDFRKAFKKYCLHRKIVDIDGTLFKELDYFLVRIEDALPQLEFRLPPHRQPRFVIAFFTEGEGEVLIGKVKVKITDQTLIIIPGQTIHSGTHGEDTRGYFLSLNLKFFLNENFPRHHLKKMDLFRAELTPYVYTGAVQGKSLAQIFEHVFDEREHHRINRNEMIILKILELLILCERLFKKGESRITQLLPLPVVEYLELIQKFYSEQHSVSFYAEKLSIHPNSLNALCKRYLLQSAKATIDLKLITEAQALLNNTSLSAKEIAFELGFHSSPHFFRFFKRHNGGSPLQFRRIN